MYEIETGISIPPKIRNALRRDVERLAVGQSIFVTGQANNRISVLAASIQKKTGRAFTTRRVDGGVRIWRVEDPAPVPKLRAAE